MPDRVVRIHRLGGPEVLTLEKSAVGDPAAGQALVRIQAIGLNRSEAGYRSGQYLIAPKLPSLMGYEASGILEAVGEGVTGFTIGEPVCVLPNFRMGEYGVYADRAIVPASSLVAPPPGLGPVEAASVWMQFFTAFGIVQAGRIALGDFVLIPAASSSVGLAAIQIANWLGRRAHSADAHQRQTRGPARAGRATCPRQHGMRRAGRGDAHHRRPRREGGVRSGRRSLRGNPGESDGRRGNPHRVRQPCRRRHAVSALERRAEGTFTARLGGLADLESSAAIHAFPRPDPAWPGGRTPASGDREDLRVSTTSSRRIATWNRTSRWARSSSPPADQRGSSA